MDIHNNNWNGRDLNNLKTRKKSKPGWATSEREIMKHLLRSHNLSRRFEIACLYWLENRTAKEIAKHFKITILAVESIIKQLKLV